MKFWRGTLDDNNKLTQLSYMGLKIVFHDPVDFDGPEIFASEIPNETWIDDSVVQQKYIKNPHLEISASNTFRILINEEEEIEEIYLDEYTAIAKRPIPGAPIRKDAEGNAYLVKPVAKEVLEKNEWIVVENSPEAVDNQPVM